jgi:hypothetical protein
MQRNRFPSGREEASVRKSLEHNERQTEDEAVAEDEAAFRRRGQAVMAIAKRMAPGIARLIERRGPGQQAG